MYMGKKECEWKEKRENENGTNKKNIWIACPGLANSEINLLEQLYMTEK